MPIPQAFFDRAFDTSPALLVKYCAESDEKPRKVKVEHRLGSQPIGEGRNFLDSLRGQAALVEFCQFYDEHDGLEFCRTLDSRYDEVRPLLELKPAESLAGFTNRYTPGGDRAWTMDLNKSKSIYRGTAPWLAFAEIDSGPACLTIFLDGDRAGSIFYVTPQPRFNILRPIAKGFNAFLDRVAVNVGAFLRLVRANVCLRGKDGENYGFVPIEYLPNGKVGSNRPNGNRG